jgi:hypothetical protein
MESNKKGIRLKHKETTFVDGIVNFFKKDNSNDDNDSNNDNNDRTP